MESFFKSLSYCTVILLIITLLGNCRQVESSADDDFSRYLRTAMNNYTNWMKSNSYDPTSPTDNVIKSGAYDDTHITFDCQLRNHTMRGLSHVRYESYRSTEYSNFGNHYFIMGWIIYDYRDYVSDGDFNCNGVIRRSDRYPELRSNLPFNGRGTFQVLQNYWEETLTLRNVGITGDYKLDLSHAWPEYALNAYPNSIRLQGDWNDTRVAGKYFDDVKKSFVTLYRHHPFFNDDTPSFPSGQVLYRYVQEIAQKVNLSQIINGNNLPDPYAPTPRPSTTESTKPSAGVRTAVQATGLILLQVSLLIWCF